MDSSIIVKNISSWYIYSMINGTLVRESIMTSDLISQYVLYLKYMMLAIVMAIGFATIYLKITPIRELGLIKKGNVACAASFGGALIGFCLPMAASMTHTLNVIGFVLWAILATIVQLLVYFVATRIIKDASHELASNNIAVGILFATFSIAIGLINAAALA